jgi:mono/diheme cytochrome c family protein
MMEMHVKRIILVAGLAGALLAQKQGSVWDGVYTAAQAKRGEPVYAQYCASCHGATLEGRGQTPPLAGSDFNMDWNAMPLSELFEKMQEAMPADKPGTLTRAQNADILAYILQFGKFPAGQVELKSDEDSLKKIQFTGDKPK